MHVYVINYNVIHCNNVVKENGIQCNELYICKYVSRSADREVGGGGGGWARFVKCLGVHVRICARVHACMHVCMHVCMRVFVNASMHVM